MKRAKQAQGGPTGAHEATTGAHGEPTGTHTGPTDGHETTTFRAETHTGPGGETVEVGIATHNGRDFAALGSVIDTAQGLVPHASGSRGEVIRVE